MVTRLDERPTNLDTVWEHVFGRWTVRIGSGQQCIVYDRCQPFRLLDLGAQCPEDTGGSLVFERRKPGCTAFERSVMK